MTTPFRHLIPGLMVAALIWTGCNGTPEGDAFGNFEATEVTVSAQADGRLLSFSVDEGDVLNRDVLVGQVDSTQLAAGRDVLTAQARQLEAQQRALGAQEEAARLQVGEAEAQVDAFRAQLDTATEERDRTRRMFDSGAATERELNDLDGKVTLLAAQLRQGEARVATARAQVVAFAAQRAAMSSQIQAVHAQQRQLTDRLEKTGIRTTVAGTVLTVLAREGELVRTGSPLFTMADLDPMTLRAYATGDQLPELKLGMDVEVLIDDGNGGMETRAGTVTFISSEAEFTPSTIQTRDARADLVYAFEVRTANADGRLKRGMPGEVRFLSNADDE